MESLRKAQMKHMYSKQTAANKQKIDFDVKHQDSDL
jgi:hypothetical protein